jgi:hypothetical protein
MEPYLGHLGRGVRRRRNAVREAALSGGTMCTAASLSLSIPFVKLTRLS